jgi:heat shock protein HtpX
LVRACAGDHSGVFFIAEIVREILSNGVEMACHLHMMVHRGLRRIWGWGLSGVWTKNGGYGPEVGSAGLHFISLSLVPAHPLPNPPQVVISGGTVLVELRLQTCRPEVALCCRIQADTRDLSRLQLQLNRAIHHRHSGHALAGMILLLATCGWILGGDRGAHSAVNGSTPVYQPPFVTPHGMQRRFGARLMNPAEAPALFAILHDICRRAALPRIPALYCLPHCDSMNAYALGGPEDAAITVTAGLLRGMTLREIAGILAHEIAHIRNNDGWAMTWASALHDATAATSLLGLISLQAKPAGNLRHQALAMLLRGAATISELLRLALSRARELDADAAALEWLDDPAALASALGKLEHHHSGHQAADQELSLQDSLTRFLRTHPATSERVGILLGLTPAA